MDNPIKLLVKDQNLEESTALSLENAFTPFLLQAEEQFELFRSESEALQKIRKSEQERLANEAKEKELENQKIREDNARLQAENKAKDDAIAKANADKKAQEDKERQEAADKEKLQQDTAYKAFLALYGCTPETKDQFTTKKLENGTIVLYQKVAEYNPLLATPASFECPF